MSLSLLTAAMTFSEVVGPLNAFVQSRQGAQEAQSTEDFFRWLQDQGLPELARKIEANHATSMSIKTLLGQGLEQLRERLEKLDRQLATLALADRHLAQLASALRPEGFVSDTGLRLLAAVEQSTSGEVFEVQANGLESNCNTFLIAGARKPFDTGNDRFFADDIDALLDHGLLKANSQRSRGSRTLRLTRTGSEWIRAIMATRPDLAP